MDAEKRREAGNDNSGNEARGHQAQQDVDQEPPYEFWYEVGYFFRNGVPLGVSAILTWGFPPLFALISE